MERWQPWGSAKPAAPDGSARWVPSETLLELAEQVPDLLTELIQTFETDTDARLNRIQGLLNRGDVAELRKEAHTLKGSASQMGAGQMASLCQEIEAATIAGQISGLAERIDALGSQFAEVRRDMIEYSRDAG